MQRILGIESSCDETAAAVYQKDYGILSNELFSQISLHQQFGGVMPEVASRSHIEKIPHIVRAALQKANISLNEIDAVAVANGPGLPGSLLVGLCFAKSLAFATNKPLIAVDHIQAHAISPAIENQIPFPYLCLTASGGHTSLTIVESFTEQTNIATTRDDAAGEAFDKVAKLLNLGYPGGPIIEQLAASVNYQDQFHYPRLKSKELFFSFSGLKTAVLYHAMNNAWYNAEQKLFSPDVTSKTKAYIASSFLNAVSDIMKSRIQVALQQYPGIQAIAFAGGVACNSYLKQQLAATARQHRLPFFAPAAKFCTDNAAMIAFLGYQRAQKNLFADCRLDLKRW